jgi:hypothetical protein
VPHRFADAMITKFHRDHFGVGAFVAWRQILMSDDVTLH